MYKKVLIGAATAVAIVGVGGTALAVTGSDTTSGTPSPSGTSSSSTGHSGGKSDSKGDAKGKGRARILGRHLDHAQIVTSGTKGTVTHDLVRGSVTAVSATSISVKAADGTSKTFGVTKDTAVRVRTAPASGSTKGTVAKATISSVPKGSSVLVVGTGTSTLTATQVVKLAK